METVYKLIEVVNDLKKRNCSQRKTDFNLWEAQMMIIIEMVQKFNNNCITFIRISKNISHVIYAKIIARELI